MCFNSCESLHKVVNCIKVSSPVVYLSLWDNLLQRILSGERQEEEMKKQAVFLQHANIFLPGRVKYFQYIVNIWEIRFGLLLRKGIAVFQTSSDILTS